jgi:hypothetical protein
MHEGFTREDSGELGEKVQNCRFGIAVLIPTLAILGQSNLGGFGGHNRSFDCKAGVRFRWRIGIPR